MSTGGSSQHSQGGGAVTHRDACEMLRQGQGHVRKPAFLLRWTEPRAFFTVCVQEGNHLEYRKGVRPNLGSVDTMVLLPSHPPKLLPFTLVANRRGKDNYNIHTRLCLLIHYRE